MSEQPVQEDARTQEQEDFNLRAVKGNLVWPAVAGNIWLAVQLCKDTPALSGKVIKIPYHLPQQRFLSRSFSMTPWTWVLLKGFLNEKGARMLISKTGTHF